MKTMVVSDTHGRINRIIHTVMENGEIGHIIHLGDMAKDVEDLMYGLPHITVTAVDGNNEKTDHFPSELLIEIGGKKAFLTHGHYYDVRQSISKLLLKVKTLGAYFALFGHTHLKYEEQKEGVTLLNPSNRCYILIGEDGKYDFFDL